MFILMVLSNGTIIRITPSSFLLLLSLSSVSSFYINRCFVCFTRHTRIYGSYILNIMLINKNDLMDIIVDAISILSKTL